MGVRDCGVCVNATHLWCAANARLYPDGVNAAQSQHATGPVVLIIRDGWGKNPHPEQDSYNAVKLARTPCADDLEKNWPHTLIKTSGEDVGLPIGPTGPVMGNSEVGHQNIGAGRIVDQELMRITRAIRGGEFALNAPMLAAFEHAKKSGAAVHVMGLLSDGQVHSDLSHLEAILKAAKANGVNDDKLFVHAFLDGRDTPSQGSLKYVPWLQNVLRATGGRLATVCGRFFAMDRDHRWERVKKAYDLLTKKSVTNTNSIPNTNSAASLGVNTNAAINHMNLDVMEAIHQHIAHPASNTERGDEFMPPTRLLREGVIEGGDSVIFFNFRGDRPRELCKAFVLDDAAWKNIQGGGFDRTPHPTELHFLTMAQYESGLPTQVMFMRPAKMKNILGECVSSAGLTQFRCAETEKFPHVTFFFNDYREEPFSGERREIIPSPRDIPTYDLKPAMSADGVCEAVLRRIAAPDCESLIVVNFANPDMVGHTGSLPAAIKACEATDGCVQKIMRATLARGGHLVITADHGNAEQMKNPATGQPQTAHTNFTVPLYIVSPAFQKAKLRNDGRLADIAPTLLQLLGVAQPADMTGCSLIAR
ncbi:MAG: 2,3-bisphosphoglycerate-independent phosphoglycerate mutase [Phycisphaerales bacterium]|nr:2,3-bisphosphoglycerate-independent phosphoglycerate mutase [Phycisphaerales bacterium]